MRYPKHLIIIVLINLAVVLVIYYFSDKFIITKSWSGYEYVNLRLTNKKPYRYISCQIKPISFFTCQTNTVVENFPNPAEGVINPTKIPIGNPVPFRFKR